MSEDIKTVILCGGMGTRLKEETEYRPKPMVEIGGRPILWHIMKIYSHYSFNDFILCLGYKGEIIKNYFLNYKFVRNDFTIHLENDVPPTIHSNLLEPWNITLTDTGSKTGTAGRIKKISKYVGDIFFVTYGDGVANINIKKLLEFHKSHGKIATVTAVHPLTRFGMLDVKEIKVNSFKKHASATQGWIDGGFFVFNNNIFEYLKDVEDEEMLEGRPLEQLAEDGELMAYKHEGYWKCVDTYRDMEELNNEISRGKAGWMVWKK